MSMSGDELSNESRKIETGGGDYHEGASSVDTQQMPSFDRARQLQAEVAAIRQRGMMIDDVVRLRREYKGSEELISDALQFETLQSFDVMERDNKRRDKYIRALFFGLLGAILVSVTISALIMFATLASRGL